MGGELLESRSLCAADTVGFYQPDASLFHLKDTFTPGHSDHYFQFGPSGNAGWTPLVGDWDGDGVDTVGFYQPDLSLFHLKNSFAPGSSDIYFQFGPSGNAGWTPLVGDWNGDGMDTVGFYQPDLSLFHLKNSFAPGNSDIYFQFGPSGNAGWTPLVGDWNGDGMDTVGFYQPDPSLFHLKNSFAPGSSDIYFQFGPGGNAGWPPLVGTWVATAAPKFGIIGDSLGDEHFDQQIGYSKNWFELMVTSGKINGGPRATSQPNGVWDEQRLTGYEYNFAQAGVTLEELISTGQHTQLASLAVQEGITKAVVVIGANNFFPLRPTFATTGNPGSLYEALYEGLATQEQIQAVKDFFSNNWITVVNTLTNAGIDVVGTTIPDYGIAPFTTDRYPDPTKRERVTGLIREINVNRLGQLALNAVPLVDIFSLTKDVWGENGFENSTFTLGGVALDLHARATNSSDTNAAFANDGIHPMNTIGGVFANIYMTAFNNRYGDNFVLYTPRQILENAGPTLAAGYQEGSTLEDALGKPLTSYVLGKSTPST